MARLFMIAVIVAMHAINVMKFTDANQGRKWITPAC